MDQQVASYTPSQETLDVLRSTKILFLVGPSGAGKDTIQNELLKTGRFYKVVTYTTRSPRVNMGELEQEGQDYHFIDEKTAKLMMEEKKFIEVALTHGYLYGTDLAEFAKAKSMNKIPEADIDVNGVSAFWKLTENCIPVFLLPTSYGVMKERLIKRYGGDQFSQEITKRLNTALLELQVLENTDYYVVVNKDISETVSKVLSIVEGNYDKPKFSEEDKKLVNEIIEGIKST